VNAQLFTHYLLTLYRTLTRQRLYAALNVLGLAVGIAVFLVLWLDVGFETSFERWIPGASQISVIRSTWLGAGHSFNADNFTMGATLDELRADYPQLTGTRIWNQGATILRGGQPTGEDVDVVDPSFFKVFDLPLVKGDKTGILDTPDALILTQTKAKAYFGAADPMGRRLTMSLMGSPRNYRVVGVLKDTPRNTDQSFDFLVPLAQWMIANDGRPWAHWGSEQLSTYLRFDTPAQAAALDADLDHFVDRHAAHDLTPPAHEHLRLRTQPLVTLHLLQPKDAAVIAALGVVGLLTLILAGMNYVNLATARAGLRAREVALRKVMGATGGALVTQFMAEALATVVLAVLIGLALCELTLPLINAAGGLALKLDYFGPDGAVAPVLVALLLVGVGAGVYPALILSRFQPAAVLASARTPGGGRVGARVREALVVAQFAIAIAFTIGTGVIVSQTLYLRHADIGFQRDGLIVVNSFDDSDVTATQRTALLAAWRALPGVTHVTAADIAPGNQDSTSASNFKRPGTPGDGPSVNFVECRPEFFETYGARLIAGRFLDRNHGGDDAPPATPPGVQPPPVRPNRNIVVNEAALKTLGFKNAASAIGQTVLSGRDDNGFDPITVVGVIQNIRFRSPHAPVPQTIYFMRTHDLDNEIAGVRYTGADPRVVMDRMQAEWRRIVPASPFRAKTIEDNLGRYYKPDDQHGRLFTAGAILAVLIGCVGLYGLASFNTARRVREIGIRKTLGASTFEVLRLLVGQFLRPVLLANLIAWPLAWLAMRSWLGGFDQRITLSPLYFLAATALTLVIAVATVAGQAFAVARAEPAKALRHE